jgi:hypothetical protein
MSIHSASEISAASKLNLDSFRVLLDTAFRNYRARGPALPKMWAKTSTPALLVSRKNKT